MRFHLDSNIFRSERSSSFLYPIALVFSGEMEIPSPYLFCDERLLSFTSNDLHFFWFCQRRRQTYHSEPYTNAIEMESAETK